MQNQDKRFGAAEGLQDTDIRSAATVEGKYCSVEKPDLDIDLHAVAANLVERLQVSEDSLPSHPGAAGVKAHRGK